MQKTDSPRSSPSRWWAISIPLLAIVVVIGLTAVLVMRSLARLPEAAVDQTKELMETARDLAEAFRQGTIETRFFSYATSISGSTYLQIATIDRLEVFTREDRSSIFWGAVPLPDVVVSATAPVQYTAYVDLNEPWHLTLQEQTLLVLAPSIRFNRPSIDASRIDFEIEEGSLLRDEDAAMEDLKSGLTGLSHRQAQGLRPEVEETARRSVESFVRGWLLQSFSETEDVQIEVVFQEERTPDQVQGIRE